MKNINISTGLGFIFLGSIFYIGSNLIDNVKNGEFSMIDFFLPLLLILFIGTNVIGLFLRKKWALMTSNLHLIITFSVVLYSQYEGTRNGLNSDIFPLWRQIFNSFSYTLGMLIVLNSAVVKKEFSREFIHDDLNDLDNILDA